MKIILISHALPPQLDGIGDYTANLVAELAKSAEVKILTATGFAPSALPGIEIQQVFSPDRRASISAILTVIEADAADWVLLQYNPFAYGNRGLNPYLPLAIRAVKRRCPRTRIAIMAHETFIGATTFKASLMSAWQRAQLWSLGRNADVIFFSIAHWTKQFKPWFPNAKVYHLPVGSNIPLASIGRDEARARLGIADSTLVLGLFGTAHPSRMLDWCRDAANSIAAKGNDILVLHMGPDASVVCKIFAGLPTLAEGPLPADEVSRRFAAMDIALMPFSDGVSTRRTSMMTALQHGIATIGTRGWLTDPMLGELDGSAFLLADSQNQAQFLANAIHLAVDAKSRSAIGRRGRQVYEREFAWHRASERMLEKLSREQGGKP